jgi:DNA-binding NarL/FixJ family response regulator
MVSSYVPPASSLAPADSSRRDGDVPFYPDTAEREIPLMPRQLLVLQLHARGYTVVRIGQLLELPEADVTVTLHRAAAVLGRSSVHEAVAEAKRRSLIV